MYRQPDTKYHPERWFSTVRCRHCGLAFVNPRPGRAEIGDYYPAEFYEYFEKKANQAFHVNRYRAEASFIERHNTEGKPGRLLDVGCANGDFPRFMQNSGWHVEGVEVSLMSQAIGDFPVYKQEFPDAPLKTGSYDVVTAWAVLEHVHDPMAHFKKAAEVLCGGGLFVFLVTNFSSITSSRLFGEDIPRHLYFFSESSVREYLRRTEFELVEADYSDRIYQMLPVNWLRYYLRSRSGRPFEWQDSRLTHDRYLADHGIARTRWNQLKFFAGHPLSLIDRITAPAFAKYQMLNKTYGIVTYVARRKHRA